MSGASRIAIVGGGPAGKAAAGAYRDAGGMGTVTILSSEGRAPYRRPPLTKEYLRRETEVQDLALEEADWYRKRGIELVLDADIQELDVDSGLAASADGRSWEFDLCLLATGARPVRPDVPGADEAAVHTVRRVSDSDSLARLAGERVVVVGSGFIGCEAAVSLAMRGSDVTIATVEPGPQIERLGPDAAERIEGWLRGHGVAVEANAKLMEIAPGPGPGATARFADGREAAGAGVLLALGIERNDELAARAGLETDDGVAVDASMRSESNRLLAAGDVAHARNAAAGRALRVEHWGEALNQGKVAGGAMAGTSARWDVAPGFWSSLGERTVKYVGWGDGWDEVRFEPADGEGFAAWYGRQGELVGVLTHQRDDDYERGRQLIESRAPWN